MDNETTNAYQRLMLHGVRSVTINDLVAVGMSRRESDVEENEPAAVSLIRKFGKVQRFRELVYSDLKDHMHLEGFENYKCLALVELGRRTANSQRGEIEYIESPEDAFELLSHYAGRKKEFFVVVLLNAKNGVIRIVDAHVGTLTASLVGAREVFGEAIREGASAIIVAHNHPSGDPTPSPEDFAVSKRLQEIGQLLDIPVLDHFVIGDRHAVSAMSGGRVGG